MLKRFSSALLVVLLASGLAVGQDKSKKAYELIYEDVQNLRRDLLRLEDKIEQNRTEIDGIKSQITELLSQIRLFQTEQADFKEQQKNLPAQFQALLERLDSISSLMSRFADDLTELKQGAAANPVVEGEEGTAPENTPPEKVEAEPPKEEGEGQEATPPVPNLSPQEVYNMAYSDYLKGQYQLAIDGFNIYLNQFGNSPLADNAQYWIGECFFSQQEYDKAIEQFDSLILNFPSGDKIPAAYLKKGLSLLELDRKEQAVTVLKLLISKFPLEEETRIAQEKLRELGIGDERR